MMKLGADDWQWESLFLYFDMAAIAGYGAVIGRSQALAVKHETSEGSRGVCALAENGCNPSKRKEDEKAGLAV